MKTKNYWQIFLAFSNVCYPKTHLIKALDSLDSSRPYKRPLKNQNAGGSKKYFLPENDFQTSSTVNFPKKSRVWSLDTNRKHETQT